MSFLRAHALLLPLPLYFLASAAGLPQWGALAGLLYLLWLGVRRMAARPVAGHQDPSSARPATTPVMEKALTVALALVFVLHVAGAGQGPGLNLKAWGAALLFAGLGLGALTSVAVGRPWTSEFSAGEFAGSEGSPLFQRVNRLISLMWGVLFLWMALAAALHAPAWAHALPALAGALASLLLPRKMVARGLAEMAAGDTRNNWPAPDFSSPSRAPDADPQDEHCDVAVVGAGMGGLTAAALLAHQGLKVIVCEQHVLAGGFAHNWLRRARTRDPVTDQALVFRFDSGVHDISGWHDGGTVRRLFERLGIADELVWHRLDHRYQLDGKSLDVPRDPDAYLQQLCRLYPAQAVGLTRLFADIRAIYEGMFSTADARGGVPGVPPTPQALLDYARRFPLNTQWMDKPWDTFVRRHVSDPGARQWIDALAGYIGDDVRRFKVADMVPIYGYYLKGGYYPQGGSGRMADALVGVIGRAGGRVHLKTAVRSILVHEGRACGLAVEDVRHHKRRIHAQAVISNADALQTLHQLLPDPAMAQALTAQCGLMRPATSAFGIHLGIRGTLDLPPVIHLENPGGYCGLVIPSRVDPDCAPAGYSTLEILELVSAEQAAQWLPAGRAIDEAALETHRHDPAYLARKQRHADALLARVRRLIPDLDERIVYRCDASPLTYARYAWSSAGAIYGTQAESARLPVKTPLRHLVLAGAATHGPGVEAVMISGAYAAEALCPGLLADVKSP